jgi:hypothetical protein
MMMVLLRTGYIPDFVSAISQIGRPNIEAPTVLNR